MYYVARIEEYYQIEVAVLWIRSIMMWLRFWADTWMFFQRAYSSPFGILHHHHRHYHHVVVVVACTFFLLPTHVSILAFLFTTTSILLPSLGFEERDGGPFTNKDCLNIILLYCLRRCVEWFGFDAAAMPQFTAWYLRWFVCAFIICNYSVLFFNEILRFVLFFWMNNMKQG